MESVVIEIEPVVEEVKSVEVKLDAKPDTIHVVELTMPMGCLGTWKFKHTMTVLGGKTELSS